MLNEFRQDLVSGDWVLFATSRTKGHTKTGEKFFQPKESCPFEDPQKSGNGEPVLTYYKTEKIDWLEGREWTMQVIKNKFPALTHGVCQDKPGDFGPFKTFGAFGFHELVVTKDHDKNFSNFTKEETAEVLAAYIERYKAMAKDSCGDFILIFHNFGQKAGATIFHNHSQIMSMPVVPPDILRSMKGAEDFYNKNKKKVYDVLLDWEMKEKKRIVFENDKFLAFCPFVSRTPYEIKIFPKIDSAYFEKTPAEDLIYLAEVLNIIIAKIDKVFSGIDYNFYIHTAPVKKENSVDYDFYRWHIEVIPRISMLGGLELGSNVFINVIDPDEAAKLFKETEI